MNESEFIFKKKIQCDLVSEWTSPSNIALIKYWGKQDVQIPKNPSISLTLSNCRTQTRLTVSPVKKYKKKISFDLFFDGNLKPEFNKKVEQFFFRISKYVPFVFDNHFKIETKNFFPHSSGIASSASAFSSMALTIVSLERKFNDDMNDEQFYKKSSFLSRLGSGSASRSIFGKIALWGESEFFSKSSNLYSIPLVEKINPIFNDLNNTVLIVDDQVKEKSSSYGHNLMNSNPFSFQRYEQAKNNIGRIKKVFKNGDLDEFIQIVESEALTLHGLMMSSNPYYLLLKPNSVEIIRRVWDYRREYKYPVCFSLDAGSNIHLLYPSRYKKVIKEFITNDLINFCKDKKYIDDYMGSGPEKIK